MSNQDSRFDFEHARRRAFLRAIRAAVQGRPNRLLSWEEVREHLPLEGQVDRGLQSVPLEKIIGSVNRYRDFDRAFFPVQDHTADRWQAVSRALHSAEDLPPVRLYKVGDAYFVVDGNHRVSVAREAGFKYINAQVIEVQTRVPVAADVDAEDLEIIGEYANFLRHTRLDELRPDQRIAFTIAGGYDRLLEHIAAHRYFMAIERERPVPEDEAVADWYDNVYMPVVRIIRKKRILKDFPNRTEADLYLWIMEHQHFIRQEYGVEVGTEVAAAHFAEHYSARLLRRIIHRLRTLLGRRMIESRSEEDGSQGHTTQ